MFHDFLRSTHLLLAAGLCVGSAGCSDSPKPPFDAGLPPIDAGPPDVGVDAQLDAEPDATPPPLMTMRFEKIVAGSTSACGISDGGNSVRCWGTAPEESPSFSAAVVDLCLFGEHLCAVTSAGNIECLNLPPELVPPTDGGYVALECMNANACARRDNGERVCWGSDKVSAFETSTSFVSYDGCNAHACGLYDDGTFECFGSLTSGLGDARAQPFETLVSGTDFNCGLTADGTIDCWGRDAGGRLDAPAGTGFVYLDASFLSGCALDADRFPTCWGASRYWDTAPALALSTVSVGAGFACGLTADEGRGICWGQFQDGQTEVPLEGE